MVSSTIKDLKRLLCLHHITNIILATSYIVTKTVQPFCTLLHPTSGCELDFRDSEILTFLAVILVFKTRKQGATNMVPYISSACMYTKIANILLFFYADPRMGVIYILLCLLHLLLLPEPTYQGPDNIVYFHGPLLEEEFQQDKHVTWIITFYAAWNPSCVSFAPIFAELSAKYSLSNLKFGKLDVTRYPEIATKYCISTSAFSKQLPTVIIFKNGKEVCRRPTYDHNGKLINFFFSEENVLSALDINNLYQEHKNNPPKKKKNEKQSIEENHLKSE